MPDTDLPNVEKIIKAIQNIGIMLDGASEYVCEGGVLKRFSGYMEDYLRRLETDIASLKKRFPGKFPETPELDSSLSRIKGIAKTLRRAESDVEAKCRAGDLGHALKAEISEVRSGVLDISQTVSGKVSGYSISERITGHGGKITSALYYLSPFAPIPRKVILAALTIALIGFGYLFFAMESEDALIQSIRDDVAFLQTQEKMLSAKRQEYSEIKAKIKILDKKNLSRKDKIELLRLSVEEGKIGEFIERTAVSIEKKEKELAGKNKRLEELQKKSFFQKLFKK
jgi:hypothetical protein